MPNVKLEQLVHIGASISQLSVMFKMDSRDIKARLIGKVNPVKRVGSSDLWSIKEVSKYLSPSDVDIDELVKHMSKAELPHTIQKEFWAGMRSRQEYEIRQGDLWHTEQVQEVIAGLFKTIRMSLLLTRDNIERRTELTSMQRNIVEESINTALEELHAKTNEYCIETDGDDTSGSTYDPFADSEV